MEPGLHALYRPPVKIEIEVAAFEYLAPPDREKQALSRAHFEISPNCVLKYGFELVLDIQHNACECLDCDGDPSGTSPKITLREA